MTIERLHYIGDTVHGRCRASIHNGLVYAVATDENSSSTVAEQTLGCLASLDEILGEARIGKDRIVQATVYLRDIATKPEMDAVWSQWIGQRENWPQRACVGADLAQDDLVEIVLIAAVES